jgi:hypothetical protein
VPAGTAAEVDNSDKRADKVDAVPLTLRTFSIPGADVIVAAESIPTK